LYNKPDDPSKFIASYLEKVKVDGLPPLLTTEDIDTMFAMMDVTNKGCITGQQANNVAQSVLGLSADLGLAADEVISKETFQKCLLAGLKKGSSLQV
jgi:hypothetical protein